MTRSKNKTKGDPLQDFSSTISLTTEEILETGERAAELLNAPVFLKAVGQTLVDTQNDWIATAPHESQKREGLYQQTRAMNAVMAQLQGMVQATQGINLDVAKKETIDPTFQ